MRIWLNHYPDGALLDTQPAGDRSVSVDLPDRETNCILHLLALESYELAAALGSLAAWGAQREPRRE